MSERCYVFLAVLLLVLTGCSHLHPWATDRDIEGTYDQVFQATLETLESRAFPLEEVNRDAGRIVTGKRPVDVIEARRRVEKVRAYIREEAEGAEVQLFLTFMDQSGSVDRGEGRGTGALSSSAIYDEYLDAIEERVRELRDGESRLSDGSS